MEFAPTSVATPASPPPVENPADVGGIHPTAAFGIVAAVVGALVAQYLSHRFTRQRERRTEFLEVYDRTARVFLLTFESLGALLGADSEKEFVEAYRSTAPLFLEIAAACWAFDARFGMHHPVGGRFRDLASAISVELDDIDDRLKDNEPFQSIQESLWTVIDQDFEDELIQLLKDTSWDLDERRWRALVQAQHKPPRDGR